MGKIAHLIQLTCCAACGCKPPLGTWPAGWNTTHGQGGVAPEWFINKNCFINAAHDELQVGCQWSALTLIWSIVPHVQQGLLEGNITVEFYSFRNGISQWLLPQPQPNYYSPVSVLARSDKMLVISCSMGQQALKDGLGTEGFRDFPRERTCKILRNWTIY